ncbi:MAG: hypothetical protein U0166_10720 [Acidobacteriota bacterium]
MLALHHLLLLGLLLLPLGDGRAGAPERILDRALSFDVLPVTRGLAPPAFDRRELPPCLRGIGDLAGDEPLRVGDQTRRQLAPAFGTLGGVPARARSRGLCGESHPGARVLEAARERIGVHPAIGEGRPLAAGIVDRRTPRTPAPPRAARALAPARSSARAASSRTRSRSRVSPAARSAW